MNGVPRLLSHRRRGRAGVTRLVVVALVMGGWTLSAQRITDEFRLKAAVLFKLAQFVDWPAPAVEHRRTVDLCVAAPNPFGRLLEALADGESLNGRSLAVRETTGGGHGSCHVLFLPNAATMRKATLERIGHAPILTVSDAPQFLDEGGMVQLRVIGNRVRFDVSLTAAEQAGLRISPQLLRLAERVRGAK